MNDTTSNPNEQSQPAQRPQPNAVDDSKAVPLYANFCRVTGTPEELIVDFGLNVNPFDATGAPVEVSQRIIVNYYTAKRLLQTLAMTVQRHESIFGVLETDVQKRVSPAAQRRMSPQPERPSAVN
jgi:hypothetical protein